MDNRSDARNVKNKMLEFVRANSGIEQKRDYLGMSQIGRCPRMLYRWIVEGKGDASDAAHLNCISGYMLEDKMLWILAGAGLLGSKAWATLPKDDANREIVAPFDNRFRGHIDGEMFDGTLLEVKTFNADDYNRVTRTNQLPKPYIWQVQAYMRYGDYDETLMVLVCRDPFTFWTMTLKCDDRIGAAIDERARMILSALDDGRIPVCACGRCDSVPGASSFNRSNPHPAAKQTTRSDYAHPTWRTRV